MCGARVCCDDGCGGSCDEAHECIEGSFYLKEMRAPLAGEVLVCGEARYGTNELNNRTGNRAALDCLEGVNLDTLAADARLTFNFNPSR